MIARKLRAAALAACASLGLTACSTYDDGYGFGRTSYSVGLGYGSGYYDGWGPGYGWYDGYYYPGSGYYVFDRAGRRSSWNDRQRDYWRSRARTPDDRREIRRNFRDYRQDRRGDRSAFRADRQADRQALQNGTVTRDAFRAERREDRRSFRQERSGDRRQLLRQNRRALRN